MLVPSAINSRSCQLVSNATAESTAAAPKITNDQFTADVAPMTPSSISPVNSSEMQHSFSVAAALDCEIWARVTHAYTLVFAFTARYWPLFPFLLRAIWRPPADAPPDANSTPPSTVVNSDVEPVPVAVAMSISGAPGFGVNSAVQTGLISAGTC